MANELRVETHTDGPVCTIVLTGDVDLASRPAVDEAMTSACTSAATVTVDLSGVTFMDSSGLNALIAAAKLAGESDCELAVCSPSDPVRRLFEIAGVGEVLKVIDA